MKKSKNQFLQIIEKNNKLYFHLKNGKKYSLDKKILVVIKDNKNVRKQIRNYC